MSRLLATIRISSFKEMKGAEGSLVEMISGIVDGAMSFDNDPSGLLRNRLDDDMWFGEAAGTALLGATGV